MRSMRVVTMISLILAALLLAGPGAAGVSAAPTYSKAGFACQPRGTLPGAPSTTLSTLNVDFAAPAGSTLTCYFRGTSVPSSIGGPCQYDDAAIRVDFQRRVLVNLFGSGRLLCWGGVVTTKTDLSITKTDGAAAAVPGNPISYTIVVMNGGSVPGVASVADTFPAAITNVSWTAVGAGDATGFSPAGNGSIADTVNLPAGASVTYTVTGTIDGAAAGTLSNTATVAAGANTIDTNAANNSATDTDTLAPVAPGSAILGSFTVNPLVTNGPYPPVDRVPNPNVNLPYWTVPTGPFVPGIPTGTQTTILSAPGAVAASGAAGQGNVTPQGIGDITEFDLNSPADLTSGTNNGTASTTAEPSGAANGGGVVFLTANWLAAYSTDGGVSFTELDPTTVFPADAVGFCCDQVVQYIPSIDRFIWFLQGTGYRLAMASPAQIVSSGGTAWTYWNLTQGLFGQCINFDYPDVTLGDAFLYMSWDAGTAGTCTGGFQVARTSFAGLAAAGTITVEFTDPANAPMAWGSHITSNTGNEVYWAGHNNSSSMRIFSLAENSTTYFWRDRTVASWPNNAPTSTTPDGQDWLAKNFNGPGGNSFPYNGVIGATRSGNHVWFGWTAGTNSSFAQAHIQIVTFDPTNNYNLVRQVQVWNSGYAFAYPAFATNGCTGEIGMSFEFGGGGNYENHVVGFWGDFIAWITTGSNTGTNRFGDYVTIRRAVNTGADPGNMFDAFGYGLVDPVGPTGVQTDVRYVRFGRPATACVIVK